MAALARITLAEIGLVGHHGYHEAEKELGQRFEIDVDLFVDIERPGGTDRLTDAVNYEKVYELVEGIVRDDRFSLLEALVSDIVERIYREFDVQGVTVRVRKPSVPHCPNLGYVEIELSRGETLE
jgi:dihydroneopterin aldolase